MAIFNATLTQMLLMFTLMAIGFLLRKKRILPEDAGTVMSRLETYVLVPALYLHNMLNKCTVETFTQNSSLILTGAVIVLAAMALGTLLCRIFVPKAATPELAYQRNIYKYAMTFGNYGFMGNFLVLSVWGSDAFFTYSMFTMIVGIFCSSWGLYILIPKEQGKGFMHNLLKGLLTPMILALVIGIIGGLLNVRQYLPAFFLNMLESTSACMGPVAMLLGGFVIGGYDFLELLKSKKVYLATLLRLVVIPGALMLILRAIGMDDWTMTLALVAFATPLGLNTIVYPAAYGGDTKTGASMAMISHTLSVITIPLMYLIFIVLL